MHATDYIFNTFIFFTEGYPPLVFPTMHMMVEALNMHVITVSWDLQYLTCLAESSRAKLKAIEVTEMNSGTTVSQPGNLFYDTLKVIQYAAINTYKYNVKLRAVDCLGNGFLP